MPYITNTTTGELAWSTLDRDQVINWSSDQYRTAAERLTKRVEQFLYDDTSDLYHNFEYLGWAVAAFDHEKATSRGYPVEFDPQRARTLPDVRQSQFVSSAPIDVRLPEAAHQAGYVPTPEDDA